MTLGAILLTALYIVFLLSIILFCSVSNYKVEDERQARLKHWDEEVKP